MKKTDTKDTIRYLVSSQLQKGNINKNLYGVYITLHQKYKVEFSVIKTLQYF